MVTVFAACTARCRFPSTSSANAVKAQWAAYYKQSLIANANTDHPSLRKLRKQTSPERGGKR